MSAVKQGCGLTMLQGRHHRLRIERGSDGDAARFFLSRDEIHAILTDWLRAWNDHDLDAVMALFHDEVLFENWTGARVQGKRLLQRAWRPWFRDHGDFHFRYEDLFIDEGAQKVLFQWELAWLSPEAEGGAI